MRNKTLWSFTALVLILIVVNISIYQKEAILASGTTVCLRLAPVDPRSLMQGDYMRLRFSLAGTIRDTLRKRLENTKRYRIPDQDGYALLQLDTNCSAQFLKLGSDIHPGEDRVAIHYRVRHGTVKIASNAFFFQEGKGKQYQKARYGIFKLSSSGDPLLFDLADTDLRRLSQAPTSSKN